MGEPTAPEQWALATGLQLTSPAHRTAVRRTHDDEATTGIDRTGQGAQTHSRGRSTVRMYGCTELRCTSRASRISCGEPRIKRRRIAAQQSAPWCRPRASCRSLSLSRLCRRGKLVGWTVPTLGIHGRRAVGSSPCVSVQPIHALSHPRPPAAAASPTQPSSRHLHLLSLCPGRAACRTACCSLASVAPPLRGAPLDPDAASSERRSCEVCAAAKAFSGRVPWCLGCHLAQPLPLVLFQCSYRRPPPRAQRGRFGHDWPCCAGALETLPAGGLGGPFINVKRWVMKKNDRP